MGNVWHGGRGPAIARRAGSSAPMADKGPPLRPERTSSPKLPVLCRRACWRRPSSLSRPTLGLPWLRPTCWRRRFARLCLAAWRGVLVPGLEPGAWMQGSVRESRAALAWPRGPRRLVGAAAAGSWCCPGEGCAGSGITCSDIAPWEPPRHQNAAWASPAVSHRSCITRPTTSRAVPRSCTRAALCMQASPLPPVQGPWRRPTPHRMQRLAPAPLPGGPSPHYHLRGRQRGGLRRLRRLAAGPGLHARAAAARLPAAHAHLRGLRPRVPAPHPAGGRGAPR